MKPIEPLKSTDIVVTVRPDIFQPTEFDVVRADLSLKCEIRITRHYHDPAEALRIAAERVYSFIERKLYGQIREAAGKVRRCIDLGYMDRFYALSSPEEVDAALQLLLGPQLQFDPASLLGISEEQYKSFKSALKDEERMTESLALLKLAYTLSGGRLNRNKRARARIRRKIRDFLARKSA